MNSQTSLQAGGFSFSFRSPEAGLRERATALLCDLPTQQRGPTTPIDLHHDGDLFHFKCERRGEAHGSEASLFASLITLLNRKSLDAGSGALHLHAGTVARDGTGLLIVAPSGKGKTTTTAAMALRGWDYLSDETAEIKADHVRTWPKPLSIKRSGFDVIQQLTGNTVGLESAAASWVLPASHLGLTISHSTQPRTLVFLEPGAPLNPRHLSAADAVVTLVEQTMDFERVGPNALLTLARLAASCVRFSVGRSDPARMAQTIEAEALGDTRVEPVEVTEMQIPWAETITTVFVGEDAVLRNNDSGVVASLNADGAASLRRMTSAAGEEDLDRRDTEFLRQLKAANLMPTFPTGGSVR